MSKEANKSEWSELLRRACQRAKGPTALSEELGVNLQTIRTWLRRMRLGLDSAPRKWEEMIEKLRAYLNKPFISGPHPCGRVRMWQSMRCVKTFTPQELAAIAQVPLNSVWQYLKVLRNCGYLSVSSSHPKDNRPTCQLIRDTGPKPPTTRANRAFIFDNNLNQEITTEHVA